MCESSSAFVCCRFPRVGLIAAVSLFVAVVGQGAEPQATVAASASAEVLELLFSGGLRKELELVPEQVAQLRALGDERREMIAIAFRQLQGATTAERRKKIEDLPKEYAEIDASLEKGVTSILLPHQLRRWRQIRFQATYRNDLATALVSDEVAQELALTPREREVLATRMQVIKAEFQQELAALRRKTEEKILRELPPPQRAKLNELFGEPYFPPK